MQQQKSQVRESIKVDDDFFWLRDLIADLNEALTQKNEPENPCESAFYQSPQSREREASPKNQSTRHVLDQIKEACKNTDSNPYNHKFQGTFSKKNGYRNQYHLQSYIGKKSKRQENYYKRQQQITSKKQEVKRFCSCLLKSCICNLIQISSNYYLPKETVHVQQLNPQQQMELEKNGNDDYQAMSVESCDQKNLDSQDQPTSQNIQIEDIEGKNTIELHQQAISTSEISKTLSTKRIRSTYQPTLQFKKVHINQDFDWPLSRVSSENYIRKIHKQEGRISHYQNRYEDNRHSNQFKPRYNNYRHQSYYNQYNNQHIRNPFTKKHAKTFVYKQQFKLYDVNVQLKFGSFNALTNKDALVVPFHSLTLQQNPAKYIANKLKYNIYEDLKKLQKTAEMSVGRVWPARAKGLQGYCAVYWLQAPISYQQEEAFCESTLKKGIERVFELIVKQNMQYVVFPSFSSWPMMQSKKAHSILLREIMRNISNNQRNLALRDITIVLHQQVQYKQLVGCWRQVIDQKFDHGLGSQFTRNY